MFNMFLSNCEAVFSAVGHFLDTFFRLTFSDQEVIKSFRTLGCSCKPSFVVDGRTRSSTYKTNLTCVFRRAGPWAFDLPNVRES